MCFLYGFIRPEQRLRARASCAEEFPEAFICISHEVAPEFREFERLSTTVVNAYLGPVMQRLYPAAWRAADGAGHRGDAASDAIERRRDRLRAGGADCRCAPCCPGRRPAWSARGRSGGMAGYPDLITFDMGGTCTDVALLQSGVCRLASEAVVHGYPIKAPMLDIHTVGAGGGSIAYVDRRSAQGRAAQCRRRSGPGLLRSRQHGTDRHRCQRGAADAEPDAPAGRPHARAPGSGAAAIERLAATTGARADGDGTGHHFGCDCQHGARHPGDQRAARARSARLHPDGVRRRRTAACCAAGKGVGHLPHPGAAQSRHSLRHGSAADRSAG